MAIIVKTNTVPLFSGEFYGQASITYTTNTSNRTLTVRVDGLRAYCKYGWNFTTHCEVRISSSSNSSGAVTKTGDIAKSGSRNYKGWLPKSGYDTKFTISKSFSFNNDGSVPPVWIYLRMYNDSIEWLSQGRYVKLNVTANTDIKSQISPIGPAIPPKPSSCTITCTSFTATTITYSISTGSTATNYRVYLDGSLTSATSRTGTLSVSSRTHTIRAEARNGASDWTGSNTVSVDCTRPSIYNARITPTSSNTGTLSFTSNYRVNYNLGGTNLGTVNANSNPNKSVSLNSNTLRSYTLNVQRADNTAITNSTTISNVDTRLATIQLSYKISGTTFTLTATASAACYNWYYVLDGVSYFISSSSTSSVTATISNLTVNKQYSLYVYATRSSSGLRSTSNTVYPKATGSSRIWTGNSYSSCVVYICTNPSRNTWTMAIPYVWDNGGWKICI